MIAKLLFVIIFVYLSSDVFGEGNVPNARPQLDLQNENIMQQQSPLLAHNEKRKPCKHRAGFHDKDWVNVYKRRLLIPLSSRNTNPLNTDLISQSLKDGDYQDSVNNKLRRSGNNRDPEYPSNPLLNIFFDRNKDFISERTANELRAGNQELVSDLCKNYIDRLAITDTGEDVDQRLMFQNSNTSVKSQNFINPISTNLPLAPEKIQTLTDCATVGSKKNKLKNTEQSRRFLHNDNDEQNINFPQQNSNDFLDDTERVNNELYESANNYNSVEEPPYGSSINKKRDELPDPTKGVGVTRLSDTKILLSGTSRVCYACTSASNPSCWIPDRRTTVKYCRKDHNACVTKIFKADSSMILIRDCASSCDATETPGITPKYESCIVCHSDLCNDTNDAFSINNHNLIVCLIIMSFFRATF